MQTSNDDYASSNPYYEWIIHNPYWDTINFELSGFDNAQLFDFYFYVCARLDKEFVYTAFKEKLEKNEIVSLYVHGVPLEDLVQESNRDAVELSEEEQRQVDSMIALIEKRRKHRRNFLSVLRGK